jgi:transcriptional regulator with PAS, ATPase and Fis domain
VEELRKELKGRHTFSDIISKNHLMQKMFGILPDIAESDSTVLIEGPTGSGKELLARAIHNLSRRRNSVLVAVNCAALPDTLLESELFGYEAGAFTDARKSKQGRFARAEGGTILLDEIGDISPALQIKLLRVLQEKEYEPLGSTSPVKCNVRVLAATNKNLSQLVEKGLFRKDLFYRINVIRLTLPPLNSRKEDIPLLVDSFIERFNKLKEREVDGIAEEALEILIRHDFPGNVRELENIIEHAFVLCKKGPILARHLPAYLQENKGQVFIAGHRCSLMEMEKKLICEALERNNGNRSSAARELGIDKTTLWRKIKKLKEAGHP